MAHRHQNNRHNRGPRRNKRADDDSADNAESNVDESSAVIQMFREFQKELDTRNDRHERIVKLSRDITIESKRLIFMLHRISGSGKKEEVLQDADDKFKELYCSKFKPLADELKGQDSYQFLRAFSPGLQEYIEAVTFYYYLKQHELIGVDKIQSDILTAIKDAPQTQQTSNTLPESTSVSESAVEKLANISPTTTTTTTTSCTTANSATAETVPETSCDLPMPLTEYMLGIADFTGELMRMAINAVGSGDLDTPKEVTELMRIIHNAFSSFSNGPRELRRKATVLRQSLQKVENACYNLRVRGSEIPKHMLADVFRSTSSTLQDDTYNTGGDQEEIL